MRSHYYESGSSQPGITHATATPLISLLLSLQPPYKYSSAARGVADNGFLSSYDKGERIAYSQHVTTLSRAFSFPLSCS